MRELIAIKVLMNMAATVTTSVAVAHSYLLKKLRNESALPGLPCKPALDIHENYGPVWHCMRYTFFTQLWTPSDIPNVVSPKTVTSAIERVTFVRVLHQVQWIFLSELQKLPEREPAVKVPLIIHRLGRHIRDTDQRMQYGTDNSNDSSFCI